MMKNFRLILIGLAISLCQNLYAEPLDKIMAVVNDTVITQSEVKEQTQLILSNLKQKGVKTPSLKILQKQVLNHIIDVELQLQVAEKNGLDIDEAELNDGIKRVLQRNNINQAELKKSLANEGLTFAKYKENFKKEMLIAKLQQKTVGNQVSVDDEEVDAYLKSHQKDIKKTYHIKDIVISLPEAPSPEALAKAKTVAKNLLEKLKNGADFSQEALANSSGEFALAGGDLGYRSLAELPDIFAKDVQNMQKGQLKGPIRAPNGLHIIKLEDIKSSAPVHMVTLTHAKHILITNRNGVSDKEILAKMKSIKESLAKGKSFADLAKAYSEDTMSAKKGGDLGWVHQGELVPQFEKTMNQLAINQISAPVKSDFGYHLIQVLGRKKIDDSKTQQKMLIKQNLYQAKFQEAIQMWLQQVKASSYIQMMA